MTDTPQTPDPQTPSTSSTPSAPAATQGGAGGGASPAATEFEAITSQEEFDRRLSARLARERSKFGDYDELKAKAEQFDEAKRSEMAETERLKADLETERAARQAAEQASLRASVAAAKGVPAGALTGVTREEMEAQADEMIAWRDQNAPKQEPKRFDIDNLKSGATARGAGDGDPKALAAEALRNLRRS